MASATIAAFRNLTARKRLDVKNSSTTAHNRHWPLPMLFRATAPNRRPAYKDFLTLWNDADPDIPILKEAKAEYAKLQ